MGKFFRQRTESNPDLYCKSGLSHCLPSFDKEKTLVRRGQFFAAGILSISQRNRM